MSAYIDSQHFLLKCQKHILGIFPHIRHADIKFLLLGFLRNVKQRHLPRQVVSLILCDMIHHLHIDAHKLLPGAAQTVQCPRLDEILHGSLIHVLIRHTGDKVIQIGKQAPLFPLLYQAVNGGAPHSLDRGEGITDAVPCDGKATLSLIDIRRQKGNPHGTAGQDIFRHFLGIINDRGHKRSHKFHRIIILQPGSLIGHHRVSGTVGFVESIFGEVDHVVKNAVCHLLVNSLGNTARHSLSLISVDKILPLLLHDGVLLLAHGTAHQVASAHGVPAQIPDDLHDLLLINDAAVCGRKDGFQLRAGI